MPATWHPFGITPATEPVYIRDRSVEGVKGYAPPLSPIRVTPPPPKVKETKIQEKPIAA